MFCLFALFLGMDLLAYGLIGAGLFVLVVGIESKVDKDETGTLIVSILAAALFFFMARAILVNVMVT